GSDRSHHSRPRDDRLPTGTPRRRPARACHPAARRSMLGRVRRARGSWRARAAPRSGRPRGGGGSLAGQGVGAIWNDTLPEGRAEFYEWHNREHMPERVGIPGFRRGRRYIALDARPEFFTLYETDGPHTLSGAEYLTRLNNPTPWTLRATRAFRNVS